MATLKGTWRFNEVLTANRQEPNFQDINFTVSSFNYALGMEATAYCYRIFFHSVGNNGEDLGFQMGFMADSTVPDLSPYGVTYPLSNLVYSDSNSYGFIGWTDDYDNNIQTITIPTEQEVSDEFYAWFIANAVEYKTIKAGAYRFKDELVNMPEANEQTNEPYMSQSIDFTVDSVATYNGKSLPYRANCSMIQLGDHYVDGPELYYKIDSMQPDYGLFEFPDTIRMYGGATISNGVGYWYTDFYGEGIKQITITEDQSVSPEFHAWFMANAKPEAAKIIYNGQTIASLFGGQSATLKCEGMKMESDVVVEAVEQSGGGSTEIIDKAEAWFAKNFPSDIWSDGEYTSAIVGAPVTMRYKYRTGNADPKDIAIDGTIVDIDGTAISVTNLAEYYAVGLMLKCGRMAVDYNSVLADTLYRNPVVITYTDLSQMFSVLYGSEINVTLSAMQASLKRYDETDLDAPNNDTVASYFAETSLADMGDETEASRLYGLNVITHCEWYYERSVNPEGLFAYCGTCASAWKYFTWS